MVDSSFLLEHGVRLWFEGSRLRFKIPDNGLTRSFYSAVEGLLRENKPALRKNYTQWLTTGSGEDDRCDEIYGRFNPQTLGFEWWSPETGCIGSVFAFDTETSKIDLETHQPPDFVLGSAAGYRRTISGT